MPLRASSLWTLIIMGPSPHPGGRLSLTPKIYSLDVPESGNFSDRITSLVLICTRGLF